MIWASIIFGTISALLWIASALVAPIVKESYFDGTPAPLVKRMKIGSLLNAGGALCAAASMLCQVYSNLAISA